MSKTTIFHSTPVLVGGVAALILIVTIAAYYRDDAQTRLVKEQADNPVMVLDTQTKSADAKKVAGKQSADKPLAKRPESLYTTTVRHLSAQQRELATGKANDLIERGEALIEQGDQLLREKGITPVVVETAAVDTGSANRLTLLQARLDALGK